jgi:hypothetical protein
MMEHPLSLGLFCGGSCVHHGSRLPRRPASQEGGDGKRLLGKDAPARFGCSVIASPSGAFLDLSYGAFD